MAEGSMDEQTARSEAVVIENKLFDASIKDPTANEYQYLSNQIDALKVLSPEMYQAQSDFENSRAQLAQEVGGKENVTGLWSELHHEVVNVTQRYYDALKNSNAHIRIPQSALLGEALDNLSQRPQYQNLPLGTWGDLFTHSVAASKLMSLGKEK